MASKSVRVQMTHQTKTELESKAHEYACLYGGKPQIAGLLAQIADGRLQVSKPVNKQIAFVKAKPINHLLIQIRIFVAIGLKGTFAEIAQRIAKYEISIVKVETEVIENRACIKLVISASKFIDKDLSPLMFELEQLRFKDVREYNNSADVLQAQSVTRLSREENFESLDKKSIEEKIWHQKLVLKIDSCSIVARIRTDRHEPDSLYLITREIAREGFFISSIKHGLEAGDEDENKFVDVIDLVLSLDIVEGQKMSNEVNRIQSVTKKLESLTIVDSIDFHLESLLT